MMAKMRQTKSEEWWELLRNWHWRWNAAAKKDVGVAQRAIVQN